MDEDFDRRVKELLYRRAKLRIEDRFAKLDKARVLIEEATTKLFEGMQNYQDALEIKGDFRFDLREALRLQIENIRKAESDLRKQDAAERTHPAIDGKTAAAGKDE